jgi:hypothetical protein
MPPLILMMLVMMILSATLLLFTLIADIDYLRWWCHFHYYCFGFSLIYAIIIDTTPLAFTLRHWCYHYFHYAASFSIH